MAPTEHKAPVGPGGMKPGSVTLRTKRDKQRRIRWLYRLLDRAVERVDPERLADAGELDREDNA